MRLSIDITDELHRQVKVKAAHEGVTIAVAVRTLLEGYVRGGIAITIVEQKKANAVSTTVVEPVKPGKVPFVRPISKSDQASGKSRK